MRIFASDAEDAAAARAEPDPVELLGSAEPATEADLGPWKLIWRRVRRDRWAMASLFVIGLLILLALAAPLASKLVGHGANETFPTTALNQFGLPLGPSGDFLFGADTAGRDLFVRVLYGARTSLTIAILATGLSVSIGLVIGLTAGYIGGLTDTVLSRAIDVVLSMPILLIALGIASACTGGNECLGGAIKPGLPLVALIISLFTWPWTARLVRGQVLAARESGYVEASRAIGTPPLRIMRRQILPNIVEPLIVYATLLVPANILLEAALSYLGVGLPPTTPSWGRMLAEADGVFTAAWWMMLFPGLFLVLTTLSFNILGDGVRDAVDARSEV